MSLSVNSPWMLLHQVFSFNSRSGSTWPAPNRSAVFHPRVDDTMDSILNWYREGLIFQGGSGAGLVCQSARARNCCGSSGGTASGLGVVHARCRCFGRNPVPVEPLSRAPDEWS